MMDHELDLPLPTPSASTRAETLWGYAGLALVAATAFGLRAWGLSAQSLTMDEIGDIRLGTLPWHDVLIAGDGFPPLYHLVLHLWPGTLLGWAGERWLSVLFGMLALPVAWQLGREVGGVRAAWWSLVLLAFSPIHIWLSQEVRAYSLCFLLALTAAWLYLRALRTDRTRDWLPYGATVVAGMYSHYYFAFVVASLLAALPLDRAWRQRWRRVVCVHALLVVLCLPLLVLLRGDLQLQQSYFIRERPLDPGTLGYTFFTFVTGFTVGLSLRELHTASAGESIRAVLPWALALGPVLLALLVVGYRCADQRAQWWIVALLVVVPIAGASVLAAVLGVGYRIRYVAWCAGPFLVLLAQGLARLRDRRALALCLAVLAAAAGTALVNRHTRWRYMNEDARSVARLLVEHADRATPIFVIAGYMSGPLHVYLGTGWDLHPLHGPPSPTWSTEALARIAASRPPGDRFWLVYTRAFDGDPDGRILHELQRRAGLRLRWEVPGMSLYQGTIW